MPFCKKLLLFAALLILILLSSCAHAPRLPMPETCSPMPDHMVCPNKSFFFGAAKTNPFEIDAGGFVCYRPEEIVPFIEQCGERPK